MMRASIFWGNLAIEILELFGIEHDEARSLVVDAAARIGAPAVKRVVDRLHADGRSALEGVLDEPRDDGRRQAVGA